MCAENQVEYSSEEYDKLFKNHQEISKGQDASLIKALMQQNKYLLELKVPSEFDYELSEIKDAKIVALMDDDFNPVDQIKSEPAFYKGTFTVDKVADTFLMRPGSKGTVFINGFNLGRYWSIGPTETLYVPSAILKQGENEIVIFEQEKLSSLNISFSQEPNLGEIADKSVFA
jgi:hypothetical protein